MKGGQALIMPRLENRPLSRWKPTPSITPMKMRALAPPMRSWMKPKGIASAIITSAVKG